MKAIERLSIVVWVFLAIVPFSAGAAVITFDDGTGTQNGTLSYDGTGGALVGSGIDFHTIFGNSTSSNSGVTLDCIGCELSFTTGLNNSEGPTGGWDFDGGGSLTISGTVKNGTIVIASGTLVTGTFDSASAIGNGIDGSVLVMSGFGADTKNEDWIDFFGLTNDLGFTFATTNISIGNVDYLDNGGFTGTVTNADFDNIVTVIPVPAAVWLFGSGLLGMVGIARRKAA